MRRSAVLLMVSAIFVIACGRDEPVQPVVTPLPSGWYFDQWEGYSAGLEGESVPVVLSFIALDGQPPNAIQEVTLLADRAELPTRIEAITPSPKVGAYQLVSVLLSVEDLTMGTYRFEKVRISTGSDVQTYGVGFWQLEIEARPLDTVLRIESTTVGGSELSAIEVTLANTSSTDTVFVDGLDAQLPRRGVTFELQGGVISGSNPPAVEIEPGATADLTFAQTATSPSPAFVYVKPLLRYRVGDVGETRLFPLDGQVYAPSYASDKVLDLYIRSLPEAAHGA